MKYILAATMVLLAIGIAPALAVPSITNGSLTGPIANDGVPAGWTIVSGSPDTNDITHNVGGSTPFGALPVSSSPDGGTWVGFASDGNFVEVFSQMVAGFAIGTQYKISWDQGNFGALTGSNYIAADAVQVYLDGSPIGSGAVMPLGRTWSSDSLVFTATAASHTIGFGTVGPGPSYLSIDGITIMAAAVPEPATASLALLSLAGLAMRRRRAA